MIYKLSEQQTLTLKNIRTYKISLLNVQKKYLTHLEQIDLSKEDKKQVWDASFILEYMYQLYEKYDRLMHWLEGNEQALVVLAWLLEQLNENDHPLDKLIRHSYEISEIPNFNNKLKDLSSYYHKNELIMLSLTIIVPIFAIGIFVGSLLIAPAMSIISTILFSLPFGILLCLASASCGFTLAHFMEFKDKQNAIDNTIASFSSSKFDSFGCQTQYYQSIVEQEEVKDIAFKKTNQPKSVTLLRDRFFNETFLGHRLKLNEEVQAEFHDLMTNPL